VCLVPAVTWIPNASKKLAYPTLAVWVRSQTMAGFCPILSMFVGGATLTGGVSMLVWLAVILLVAWLLGWGVFHVAGGLIHLLLVIAVIVFLINFISGRRTV
jgi:hypothetical protein